MAHAYDTGLALPQRTLLRRGAVDLLEGLLVANGGYLRAVLPWGGVVRGYTDEVGINLIQALLNGRAPAMVVGLGDGVGSDGSLGGFRFAKALELVVYHYSNHARSVTSGRTEIDVTAAASNSADPGLDVMMEHAEELLIGQRVGGAEVVNPVNERARSTVSIKQIRWSREEELATDPTLTLWRQVFTVTVTRDINKFRDVSQLLESIHTIVRPSDVPTPDPMDPIPGERVLELETEPT